ncbi:MAG: ABC1 kinase family protein, partial [Halobacteriaceae archaeon]
AVDNGIPVAIKARRPGIVGTLHTDIDIIAYLARQLHNHFDPEVFDPIEIVTEFKDYTERELDYRVEARNLKRARERAEHVRVPKVYWSSEDLLIMEYINGEECKNLDHDREETAQTLTNSFFKQVFNNGFFHADPHPSNILVTDNDVVLVDYGITGELNEETRQALTTLFTGMITKDLDTILTAAQTLGAVDTITPELRNDLHDYLAPYYDTTLAEIDLAQAIHDGFRLARKHDLHLPRDVVLLGKAVIT